MVDAVGVIGEAGSLIRGGGKATKQVRNLKNALRANPSSPIQAGNAGGGVTSGFGGVVPVQ